ncbi:hypothetical protein [Inquilinus limosus]|uniref:Uncharacterized protein n=1 Tax=Inquilinus limosus TaxID=171674 RepID=A0A211ZPN8_9PROT|nr:hypothetical protein [Inquilinus limosus]OWJ67243.1 hypothetical protein BWR60_10620 [Inquilinus limosus]
MSLTVTYKDNKLSLVGKDGRTYEVNAAQQQQWMQTLDGLAKQHQLKDAKELLSQGTVEVPEAGDSQWRMATEAGIAPKDINGSVVALNDHIGNPDLIQTYHEGDLKPDFIMLPVAPEKPASDTPQPATKPDTSTPEKFAASLQAAPDQKTRNQWINDYVNSAEDPLDAVTKLLPQNFDTKDNGPCRQQIIYAYVNRVAGSNKDQQTNALKPLAERNWTIGDKNIDGDIDYDIWAVGKKLGIERDKLPINEAVPMDVRIHIN